jgi:uncharacterized protein involved in outer membrane biogenesis
MSLGLALALPAQSAAPGPADTLEPAGTSAQGGGLLRWLTTLRATIGFEAEVVTADGLELRNVKVPVELRDGRAVVERGAATTDAGDVIFNGVYALATRDLHASVRSNRLSLAGPAGESPRSGRLFTNKPLVPRWLPGVTGAVDVQLERFDYRGADTRNISASVLLDPSRVAVEIRGTLGNGAVTLDGTHAYASGETSIAATANAVELDAIATASKYLSGATLDGAATLRGHGSTARALAASLDGTVRAQIGRGTLNNLNLERLSQNLLAMTLLSVIPFKHAAPHTPLECAALRLDLLRGRAGAKPVIVARSDRLELLGRGTLDLGSEQIALQLQPVALHDLTLRGAGSPRTVSITGPLRAPVVKSSAGDLLHESISIGTSWATNPLARAADKVLAWPETRRTPCAEVLGD